MRVECESMAFLAIHDRKFVDSCSPIRCFRDGGRDTVECTLGSAGSTLARFVSWPEVTETGVDENESGWQSV